MSKISEKRYVPAKTVIARTKSKRLAKQYNRTIRDAVQSLRQRIPCLEQYNEHSVSKIKTLNLAMKYINHLKSILEEDHENVPPVGLGPQNQMDFQRIVNDEMAVRNRYVERAIEELTNGQSNECPPQHSDEKERAVESGVIVKTESNAQ